MSVLCRTLLFSCQTRNRTQNVLSTKRAKNFLYFLQSLSPYSWTEVHGVAAFPVVESIGGGLGFGVVDYIKR